MRNGLKAIVVACGVFITSHAFALTVMKPLDGYICMSLKVSQKYNDWVPGSLPKAPGGPDNPPVYKEPKKGAERLGYQGNIVIVAWPLVKEQGFIRILWGQRGIEGWIEENLVVPYHSVAKPTATCTPTVMSDGSVGFK